MPAHIAVCLLCLSLAGLSPAASALQLQAIELQGIEGELADNVRAQLSIERLTPEQRGDLSETRLAYLLRATPGEVQQGLEPYGYYDAEVAPEVVRDGQSVTLRLRIKPGEPVRVRRIEVAMHGPAENDSAVSTRIDGFEPRPGEPFHHAVYEASKNGISRVLNEHGYFDAELGTHRVEVTRAEHAADIALDWNSGARYALGAVHFSGSQFRPGLLDPLVPWQVGEPYDQAKLLALQQALLDLDYFGAVNVQPEPEKASDRQAPIEVLLVPAKRSIYNAGLRYGTDSGPGVAARVERRWINRAGHKMLVDTNFAQFKSDVVTQYRVPAFDHLQGWYGFAASLHEEQIQDVTSQHFDLAVTRSGRWHDWNLLAGVNLKRERFDTLGKDGLGYSTLVYPSLAGQWKRLDDVNFPRRALGVTLELRSGLKTIGSDVDFLQLRAEGRYIRGLGERNRLLLRTELGTTVSDDFPDFPPSMRFYAGGDKSVRGYGYKEIGERAGSAVFGGKHLLVFSSELERMFTQSWGAAVFVDAGDAFNQKFRAQLGIGAGLRWRSPVGLMRVDIAHGVGNPGQNLRLHISIGPDL